MAVKNVSELLQELAEHEALLWSLAGFSLLIFLGSLLALPAVIARLPSDYFMPPKRRQRRGVTKSFNHAFIVLGKNLLGALLLVLGILMLVLPGQGLLTLAVGMMLLNFPGKYRLERWVVSRGPILNALNWVRKKKQRPPLEVPNISD